MGSLVWQLNDCWPVTSWAAIDGKGREKPLYFSIAQSYEPVLLTITGASPSLMVNLINNSLGDLSGQLSLKLLDYSGKVLAEHSQQVEAKASAKESIAIPAGLMPKDVLKSNHSLTKIFNPGTPANDIAAIFAKRPVGLSL